MVLKNLSRWQAFSIHLSISFAIFFVLLYFIVFYWYPDGYFTTDGGWQGIRIIAGVDLVLGPLLTSIVFKPGKPGLKFDMTAIALFQFVAICIGSYFVYYERPVAVVWADDSFHPISAELVQESGMTVDKLATYGPETPVLIFFNMPDDPEEQLNLRKDAIKNGLPIYLNSQYQYYKPLGKENIQHIVTNALDMKSYVEGKPKDQEIYQKFLADFNGDLDNLVYVPVRSRYNWFIGVFNKTQLRMINVLNIIPPH